MMMQGTVKIRVVLQKFYMGSRAFRVFDDSAAVYPLPQFRNLIRCKRCGMEKGQVKGQAVVFAEGQHVCYINIHGCPDIRIRKRSEILKMCTAWIGFHINESE